MSSLDRIPDDIRSFAEFWPYYVKEHLDPTNRLLHFVGSSLAAATLIGSVMTGQLYLLPVAPVVGYGFAWVGHFFVEKNRPASFKYPLFSFAADWVMWSKIATGRMQAEIERVLAAPPLAATVTPITAGRRA